LQFRAYFEAHKDEYAMRQRFDPREHLKAVDLRAEAAAAAAAKLVGSIKKGELDPAAEGFNQGNGPAAGASSDAKPEVAVSASAEPDGDKATAEAASKVHLLTCHPTQQSLFNRCLLPQGSLVVHTFP
jgi:hypothetical protein